MLGSAEPTLFWPGFPSQLARIPLLQHIYMYIYAVELKTGPIFAFSSVKNWSIFFCFFVFENLILPAERRGFCTKKKKKKPK